MIRSKLDSDWRQEMVEINFSRGPAAIHCLVPSVNLLVSGVSEVALHVAK